MYNATVEFVSKVKYLGIILNCDRKDDDDVVDSYVHVAWPICYVANSSSAQIP